MKLFSVRLLRIYMQPVALMLYSTPTFTRRMVSVREEAGPAKGNDESAHESATQSEMVGTTSWGRAMCPIMPMKMKPR